MRLERCFKLEQLRPVANAGPFGLDVSSFGGLLGLRGTGWRLKDLLESLDVRLSADIPYLLVVIIICHLGSVRRTVH